VQALKVAMPAGHSACLPVSTKPACLPVLVSPGSAFQQKTKAPALFAFVPLLPASAAASFISAGCLLPAMPAGRKKAFAYHLPEACSFAFAFLSALYLCPAVAALHTGVAITTV